MRAALQPAQDVGHCEVVERPNATFDELLDILQDPVYRDRVAVFHFAGHAGEEHLFFESSEGEPAATDAGGLASLLGEQRGLELVFLNGCSTGSQVQGLLDVGVPAVVATSRAVEDQAATELSARFYRSLAGGATVRTAFVEAGAAVRAVFGGKPERSYRHVAPQELLGRWPWELRVAEGASDGWSLPQAANDPLFGLPSLPVMELPASPFKHLHPFTREDAEVFFGRGREIRDLYDAVTARGSAPIVLLFGASGVGKSSLLNAGLRPRLEADHEVVSLSRDRARGLTGSLAGALGTEIGGDVTAAWHRRESSKGRPLVVILDQLEEAYIYPNPKLPREMARFAATLRRLFAASDVRPLGRIILSFRKEWLADVLPLLEAARLPRLRVGLERLNREGIIQAIHGAESSERLRGHYRLAVEPQLPGMISDQMLEDPEAAIAPALQILMSKMWAIAETKRPGGPRFTVALYRCLKRNGLLLSDFVEEQLEKLRLWRPEFVDSGLALDLLAYHTTPLGTAKTRPAAAVIDRYGGREDSLQLVQRCKDYHLLTGSARVQGAGLQSGYLDIDREVTTRLAHDTLAPIIRRRFEASDLPGQRSARILRQRSVEWSNGREGPPLDEVDLSIVEEGERGMRNRTVDEERLIASSHRERASRVRHRRNVRIAATAAASVIIGLGMVAFSFWRQAESERRRVEQTLGRAHLQEAHHLISAERRGAALARLARAVRLDSGNPAIRGRVVDLLTRRQGYPLDAPLRHGSPVWQASFSRDGRLIVTASSDRTARIWKVATGEPIGQPLQHQGKVLTATFSQDGLRIVTASSAGTARIWDLVTGGPVGDALRHERAVHSAAFNRSGSRVVTASEDWKAQVWDAATGAPIGQPLRHDGVVWQASFSEDELRVLTASSDGTARVWDATSGELTVEFRHEPTVFSATFSADGHAVVTASAGRSAKIWDVRSGHRVGQTLLHSAVVQSAQFSRDATRIVTASLDGTARIWDAATGEPLSEPLRHEDGVQKAVFSDDGRLVATASKDGTARVWDAVTGKAVGEPLRHEDWVSSVSFGPTGRRVATASEDGTARVWNVVISEPLGEPLWHDSAVPSVSFSPDGRRVVTASSEGVLRAWDAVVRQPRGAPSELYRADATRVSFSPDGSRLVTVSKEAAQIWDAKTGSPLGKPLQHSLAVFSASFSPDGLRLVTASWDKTAKIWDAATSDPLGEPLRSDAGVRSASFSPDGQQVVTASENGLAQIWDISDRVPIGRPLRHRDVVWTASFSRDGQRIVTASSDRSARIWDAVTGEPVGEPLRHEGTVFSASFSSDGLRVATASEDKTARIWDATNGEPISEPLRHDDIVVSASFSPDGLQVVTGSWDRTARLWVVDVRIDSVIAARRLADLAEAVAGYRLTSLGDLRPMPPDERDQMLTELRRVSAQGQDDESTVASFLHWYFAPAGERTISLLSQMTIEEYQQQMVDLGTAESRREVERMFPGHVLLGKGEKRLAH